MAIAANSFTVRISILLLWFVFERPLQPLPFKAGCGRTEPIEARAGKEKIHRHASIMRTKKAFCPCLAASKMKMSV
jgi:hypothetical protein